MTTIKGILTGVGLFLIVVFITFNGSFFFSGLSGLFSNSYLQAIFWVGLILNFVFLAIVTPYSIIVKGRGDVVQAVKGFGIFIIGSFASIIIYLLIDAVMDVVTNHLSTNLPSIIWIFTALVWISLMIIAPLYIQSKGVLIEE